MSALQNSHLFYLYQEHRIQLFDRVLEESGSLESRLICKPLLTLVDGIIRRKWEDLKKNPPLGPFGFKEACGRIDKEYSIDGGYPKDFNYLKLFRALNQEWGMIGVKIDGGQLNVRPSFQVELQDCLYRGLNDFSLTQMWERAALKMYLFNWNLSEASFIRSHLSNPQVQAVLSTLRTMDFSDLGIRFIPVEICYFSRLVELKLCRNDIDFLPDFIGNLKHLRILNLEDNDLQELSKDFPNWTHLKVINLKDNPLNGHGRQQLAEWRANVAALQAQIPMELG